MDLPKIKKDESDVLDPAEKKLGTSRSIVVGALMFTVGLLGSESDVPAKAVPQPITDGNLSDVDPGSISRMQREVTHPAKLVLYPNGEIRTPGGFHYSHSSHVSHASHHSHYSSR